jgi:hypothetical protein
VIYHDAAAPTTAPTPKNIMFDKLLIIVIPPL